MNLQLDRTLQEMTTTLPPDEVLRAATRFFTRHNSIYAAFPEREGPTFVALRGQGGEEVIIGATPADGGTLVTGSTYLFDQQVARFFTTLPVAQPPAQRAVAPGSPLTADGAGAAPSAATASAGPAPAGPAPGAPPLTTDSAAPAPSDGPSPAGGAAASSNASAPPAPVASGGAT